MASDSRTRFAVVGSEPQLLIQVLLALRTSSRGGCAVITSPGDDAVRQSRLCREVYLLGFSGPDDERALDYLNRLTSDHPGLIVMASDCPGARLLHRVRSRLRARVAPIPDLATLDAFDNKWTFYQYCRTHDLPVPESQLLPSKHDVDLAAVAREVGLPFVIKPLNEQASTGVRVIRTEDDLRAIVDDEQYRYAPLVVQRFIDGIDVCIDLYAQHGGLRALACQQREWPQRLGAAIRFFRHDALERIAQDLAGSSRYHGVLLLDARIERASGHVYLLEANPRFWRSLSAAVWAGLNFVSEHLREDTAGSVMRQLSAGRADTYYHPLFRPALWPYLALPGRRGRMARLMARDLGTLQRQGRGAFRKVSRLLQFPRPAIRPTVSAAPPRT